MTAYLAPQFDTQFFDGSNVAAGYKLYTYESGTTTPKAVYSDQAGTVPHTNPIVLDANGRVAGQMFLGSGEYTFTLKTDADVLVKTWNDVGGALTTVDDALIRADLASTSGAGMVGFLQSGAGAVSRTLQDKQREVVSITDFIGVDPTGATSSSVALTSAEVAADDIFIPSGVSVLAPAGTLLTKRYWGPGDLIYSGIGPTTFTGSGLNDVSFTGSFTQPRPLQVRIRIKALNQTGISGAPDPCDTYEYSLNGGVTWTGTYDAYNPLDDQVYALPLGLNANIGFTGTPVKVGIPGTGIVPVFAANTGHTVGDTWGLTLSPNPHSIETQSGYFTKNGEVFGGIGGIGGNSVFMGRGVTGNLNNAGNQLVAIGAEALYSNVSGYANTAVGITAMRSNTAGFNNTAVGANALYSNTTGITNTAVGVYAGNSNTTGQGNASFGSDSNGYNSTGNGNSASGTQALYHNVSGNENTAHGLYALRGGVESLSNGTAQSYCTAVGAYSLYYGGGTFNTALGHQAGYKNKGNYNTFVGAEAGAVSTEISGGYNVFVGSRSGQNALQANGATNSIAIGDNSYTTGDNAVAIGSGVSSPANVFTVCNAFHTFFRPSTDNVTGLGGPAHRWTTVYAATGAINTSDEREKQQIRELSDAERAVAARLKSLIRAFRFNDAVAAKGDGARIHVGVIAQSVKAAFEAEGLDALAYAVLCFDEWAAEFGEDGNEIHPAGERYGVRYEELLAFIIAAL